MRFFLSMVCAVMMCPVVSEAQISTHSDPHSVFFSGQSRMQVPVRSIMPPPVSKAAQVPPSGPYAFAHILPADISLAESSSVSHADGGDVYIMCVSSGGALSLGFWFDDFYLEPGMELHLYSADRQTVLGALTSANNRADRSLRTAQIPGDSVFVELYVPRGMDVPALSVSKIYYDYVGILDELSHSGSALSKKLSSCSIEKDINCQEGYGYQDVKQAVVKYTFDDNYMSMMCTGTLVNNINNDATPYVLTAAHCVNTDAQARTVMVYLNYEVPVCGSSRTTSGNTMDGASLVASATKTVYTNKYGASSQEKYPERDFSLMRLNDYVPDYYKPFFAGVSFSESDNNAPFVCIHHPAGSYKKISISQQAPFRDNYPEEDTEVHYKKMNHWHIQRWSVGSTEQGSSGAPLLNSDKKVIGILSGGYASCTKPVDDYFQMVSETFSPSPSHNNQLRYWLAGDSDETEIPSYDPYKVLSSYPAPVLDGQVSADSLLITLSWHTEMPDDGDDVHALIGYRVYCNGLQVGYIKDPSVTTYEWDVLPDCSYNFMVVSVFDGDAHSSASNTYYFSNKEDLDVAVDDIGSSDMRLKVYPNPAGQQISIVVPYGMCDASLSVVDATGRMVRSDYLGDVKPGVPVSYNLRGLPQGVYVVYVESRSHQLGLRIVVR